MLKDDTTVSDQRKNIEVVIDMYQRNILPKRIGDITFVQDGQVCSGVPDMKKPFLMEGTGMQMMQSPVVQDQQLAHYVAYDQAPFAAGHEILARMRLPEYYGGNGNVVNVAILNDTGSTVQTLFDPDLNAMGYDPLTYTGNSGPLQIQTANGTVTRQSLWVEMQLMKPDGTPTSRWFLEQGIATPLAGNPSRLSGRFLRRELYFATAPGNYTLYVAQNKNGIVRQLPV
ncbi:MAG: hypothetical protein Q9187_007070 [Circinaria calcarea]